MSATRGKSVLPVPEERYLGGSCAIFQRCQEICQWTPNLLSHKEIQRIVCLAHYELAELDCSVNACARHRASAGMLSHIWNCLHVTGFCSCNSALWTPQAVRLFPLPHAFACHAHPGRASMAGACQAGQSPCHGTSSHHPTLAS